MTVYRTSSANTYDAAIRNIGARQTDLSALQENLTSGKRVVRPSDDPTSAAIAERALTRISRIATDQRALASQKDAIAQAESTLGSATDAMQRFRELVVSAGNGAHSAAERRSIANEMQGLREQVFALSNTKDTNGQPLFGALGSALQPFVGPAASVPDYTFNGLPGQSASTAVTIPFALDGDSAFMHQPVRDGTFNAKVSTIATTRTLVTDNVSISNAATVTTTANAAAAVAPPNNVPYPSYTLTFGPVVPDPINPLTGPSTTSYTITETPSVSGALTPIPIPVTFTPDAANNIAVTQIPGLSFKHRHHRLQPECLQRHGRCDSRYWRGQQQQRINAGRRSGAAQPRHRHGAYVCGAQPGRRAAQSRRPHQLQPGRAQHPAWHLGLQQPANRLLGRAADLRTDTEAVVVQLHQLTDIFRGPPKS